MLHCIYEHGYQDLEAVRDQNTYFVAFIVNRLFLPKWCDLILSSSMEDSRELFPFNRWKTKSQNFPGSQAGLLS